MKRTLHSVKTELKLARQIWSDVKGTRLRELRLLLQRYRLSIALGEITELNNHWYVTHSGLLHLAFRRRCRGIQTALDAGLSDPVANRWVFKAIVYRSGASKGFVGYGDADPSSVSPMVRGAELRIAETRAVNRALRKAYGIGLCSVEELGSFSDFPKPASASAPSNGSYSSNGSTDGRPRLRDQLCLLIRKYNLDPTLVKAYAADFCGTETLSGARRDLVQSFVSHLESAARENRDALICKLTSYAQPQEAKL